MSSVIIAPQQHTRPRQQDNEYPPESCWKNIYSFIIQVEEARVFSNKESSLMDVLFSFLLFSYVKKMLFVGSCIKFGASLCLSPGCVGSFKMNEGLNRAGRHGPLWRLNYWWIMLLLGSASSEITSGSMMSAETRSPGNSFSYYAVKNRKDLRETCWWKRGNQPDIIILLVSRSWEQDAF